MRRSVRILGLAVAVVVALPVFATRTRIFTAAAQQAQPANPEVKIDNFSFGPASLTIAAGTTVTWTNRDDIPHTVVSEDKLFKSKVLDTDEKCSFTFAKPGSFGYFCSLHPKMTGKVVVQ